MKLPLLTLAVLALAAAVVAVVLGAFLASVVNAAAQVMTP